MKNILESRFMVEMMKTASNMYRLGWDERNGGNISYLLKDYDLSLYLDLSKVERVIPLGFDASPLKGQCFLVTGTGKYFKNIETDPENNLGIVRIGEDGVSAELLWGFKDGGRMTSEFPSHLMSHMARMEKDEENRIVMHCHPTYTLAMNYVHPLDEKEFTHSLWQMCTECIVVFPDGVGVLPWMLCGTNSIGEATAEKMKEFRLSALYKNYRQYRTNELVRRRMNFSSDAMADFEGLLEVNRKICKQQMAKKASLTLPTNCAVLP